MQNSENDYVDSYLEIDWVTAKDHRTVIGGMWNEIGQLQFEYMLSQGLKPEDTLIDVGCGSLRGGTHFIPYLHSDNYYGFDINASLIEAGLQKELPYGLRQEKTSSENFHAAPDFNFPQSWTNISTAISVSLFTHLNFNSIRLCLSQLKPVLKLDGLYHSSVFVTDKRALHSPVNHDGGICTYSYRDPYHYTHEDLDFAARSTGFKLLSVDGFSHPRGQMMAVFQNIH